MKHFLATLLICALTAALTGQSPTFTPAQVKEDVNLFTAALKEAHPGLHLYLKPQELDSLIAEVDVHKVPEQEKFRALYRALLKVVVAIGDGHTGLYENTLFQQAYAYKDKELPFDVVIIDGKAYVSKWFGEGPGIPAYAELLTINNKPVASTLEEILSLTPSDGNRPAFKAAYTEKIFSRRYAKLLGTTTNYQVKFRLPNGEEAMYSVAGVGDSLLQNNRKEDIPLSFSLHPEANYAILTVNTFQYRVMRTAGLDYHAFLKDSFKQLKKNKVDHLIIDLRENYGGDNILAVALYSYLTEGSFAAMAPSLTKLSGKLSVSPNSSFPTGNYPFLRTNTITPQANGLFELRDGIDAQKAFNSDFIFAGPGNKPENIGKNKFAGKVYCLIGPLSFSATANFATLLQRDNRATFIGEETGGAKGPYCGGGYYSVTLPNSKFRLQIPFMQRKVSGLAPGEKGSGVIPDYPVRETIEDVRAGRDRGFEKVMELIEG